MGHVLADGHASGWGHDSWAMFNFPVYPGPSEYLTFGRCDRSMSTA